MSTGRKLNKQGVKKLYNELRAVFGLYDLEIHVDDQLWMKKSEPNHPDGDFLEIRVRPFGLEPKREYQHEAR